MLEAEDEAAAIETLHQLGCTDGLPVLAPTEQRVARLVLASGLDGDLDLGVMGPAYGATTVEKVCACAVMAGCLPDHMPVVIAAVRALLDPRLDLTELQATTFGTTPLVLVNGPARELCGVASGFGALGPGPRANASIGRALRLAMINLGGGRAGISDMALLGHGGKFTAVLGEDEEGSPWPPLHVARGCARIDSAVTLVGVEAPHSVIFLPPGDDESMEQAAERLLATLAAALAHPGSNNRILRGGAAVVALNPDHVRLLDLAGFERRSAAERICELTTFPRAEMERWIPALRGRGDDETARLAAFRDPDDLLWVVAGGSGLYSAVFPSWCAGPHGNRAVTVSFDPAPSCEIPG
ncbi:MAG: hypothetical protein DWQ36_06695 [Acidobacteria bacterium]|nr:MAG: hypothetical protein DWQ30_24130 [Acidobacteriota bacterium]REK09355.1 MAG: hypothetical protein DWQ36_06695 [Acidobacteriota bacterium]